MLSDTSLHTAGFDSRTIITTVREEKTVLRDVDCKAGTPCGGMTGNQPGACWLGYREAVCCLLRGVAFCVGAAEHSWTASACWTGLLSAYVASCSTLDSGMTWSNMLALMLQN